LTIPAIQNPSRSSPSAVFASNSEQQYDIEIQPITPALLKVFLARGRPAGFPELDKTSDYQKRRGRAVKILGATVYSTG
jgi:hypothetical protein